MATASAVGVRRVGRLQREAASSMVTRESRCTRCGGLMVIDLCMDLLSGTGELEFAATRCVQCGEVVDPVIERNRRLGREAMTVRLSVREVSNNIFREGPY